MTPEQRRAWRRNVMACRDLTPGQRVILLALERYADYPAGTNAHPGVERLAADVDCCVRLVKSALKSAVRLSLIEQTNRHVPKAGKAAVYRLLPVPTPKHATASQNGETNARWCDSTCASVRLESDSTCTSVHLETETNRFQGAQDDISRCTSVHPTNPGPTTRGEAGNARAREEPPGRPPPCPKHGDGFRHDEPCITCKRIRIWEEQHQAEAEEAERQERKRRAWIREHCPECEGTGTISVGENGARKCDCVGLYEARKAAAE